ncbi:UDP-N-acetylmuramoylalanyl-D-glutamyl-2,6-diaminopimelate--D-alanyl-D-alanyl ligase [Luminiphilus syltensis NOR5-1B]|uniref:UDP-N-acetylmuramoyl-tripeptide--D-alanyl-D-alanine ligase n=1 Tax=Luminiphilus syltensis NOR5-1B TaxID=565045 RepID=B8KR55_9GAMM|nr:UDP-N-acetylmuramoyl-tripeptide--D-alanyl-D-alanine ligase [Luminiphilus syltensis]EED36291.1 UDP-N-acetylmuramoylalanyl-D-glutamyl-2,6-diaminopimelate--D-alanyl-D-alanyl ligase [Luminiphilus syltensis NOR5-1B]
MIEALDLNAIATRLGAEVLGATDALRVSGVAIDSRTVSAGDLFVALRGERVDGHDYVAAAHAGGAVAAVVEEPVAVEIPQLQVAASVDVLSLIAGMVREQYRGVLVGITGSAGKTSAKTLLASVLAEAGPTLATSGNQNNEIGVPLTLFRLDPAIEFAVVEMGAGRPGDIAHLCAVARPGITALLNAAPAHLANYDSVDAIARTKGEILAALGSGDLGVFNGDQRYADVWREMAAPAEVRTFGMSKGVDVRAINIQYEGYKGTHFRVKTPEDGFDVALKLPGSPGVYNALAAIAIAGALGLSPAAIARGLEKVSPERGRGRALRASSGAQIVDDSYNANPVAVAAAIDTLAMTPGRRSLILGPMLELGPKTDEFHREMGVRAKEAGLDRLITVGEATRPAAEGFGGSPQHFADNSALLSALPDFTSGDTVLVKGSRGARLEVVVDALLGELEAAAC